MNTPEEKLAELIYNKLVLLFATEADPDIRRALGIALLNDLRTSRDTYWQERVRKEVEGMRKNENNLGFELKDKWKAEAHNQALDTLLDNLK